MMPRRFQLFRIKTMCLQRMPNKIWLRISIVKAAMKQVIGEESSSSSSSTSSSSASKASSRSTKRRRLLVSALTNLQSLQKVLTDCDDLRGNDHSCNECREGSHAMQNDRTWQWQGWKEKRLHQFPFSDCNMPLHGAPKALTSKSIKVLFKSRWNSTNNWFERFP